jgi:hypothetical protein
VFGKFAEELRDLRNDTLSMFVRRSGIFHSPKQSFPFNELKENVRDADWIHRIVFVPIYFGYREGGVLGEIEHSCDFAIGIDQIFPALMGVGRWKDKSGNPDDRVIELNSEKNMVGAPGDGVPADGT